MEGVLKYKQQGRLAPPDGTYFTTGDDIEIKLDYNHWVKTEMKHNPRDYYLKDYPDVKLEGLIARKV